MNHVLVLLSLVAAAYAGVGVVTPEIEAEAGRLWRQYCTGAADGGSTSTRNIYCKVANEVINESERHEIILSTPAPPKDQVVFIQSPSYHYKHDVILQGGGQQSAKTIIYVKPSEVQHEIAINAPGLKPSPPQKPTLYFLKGNHGEQEEETPSGGYNGYRSRRQSVDGTSASVQPDDAAEVNPPSIPAVSESAAPIAVDAPAVSVSHPVESSASESNGPENGSLADVISQIADAAAFASASAQPEASATSESEIPEDNPIAPFLNDNQDAAVGQRSRRRAYLDMSPEEEMTKTVVSVFKSFREVRN